MSDAILNHLWTGSRLWHDDYWAALCIKHPLYFNDTNSRRIEFLQVDFIPLLFTYEEYTHFQPIALSLKYQ